MRVMLHVHRRSVFERTQCLGGGSGSAAEMLAGERAGEIAGRSPGSHRQEHRDERGGDQAFGGHGQILLCPCRAHYTFLGPSRIIMAGLGTEDERGRDYKSRYSCG